MKSLILIAAFAASVALSTVTFGGQDDRTNVTIRSITPSAAFFAPPGEFVKLNDGTIVEKRGRDVNVFTPFQANADVNLVGYHYRQRIGVRNQNNRRNQQLRLNVNNGGQVRLNLNSRGTQLNLNVPRSSQRRSNQRPAIRYFAPRRRR